MEIIKQGTTPSFICEFDSETALVTDIQQAVLSITNDEKVTHHMLNELTVNSLANVVSYQFSQEETLAFKADTNVTMELHILMNDKRSCVAEVKAVVRKSQYDEVLE